MHDGILDLTDADFDTHVLESELPVLVDFWAPWCGPCKALTPTVEKIAAAYAGRLRVAKIDIQSSPQVAVRFGIRSIPALILFDGGQVRDSLIGAVSEDRIRDRIDGLLG
ncbi:MAG: thioredoxin [Candidatus Krumholzibacteriia bacterium]